MPTKMHSAMRRADDLLDGGLKRQLRAWRKEGYSWEEVADLLWHATDARVAVTAQTAANWATHLGIPTKRP